MKFCSSGGLQTIYRPSVQYLPSRARNSHQTRLSTSRAAAAVEQSKLQILELSREEALQNLQFERAAAGNNFAIVISHVEPGSQSEKDGLRKGQQLVRVSSPMQSGELWSINDRPSLRFVKDAINLNRTGVVTIEVTQDQFQNVKLVPEDPEGSLLDNMEDLSQGSNKSMTLGEKLAAKHKEDEENDSRGRLARERRIQRRKDYMDRESNRDNSKFFVGLILAFFAPAVGILIYAFQSGLLDRINSGYRPY